MKNLTNKARKELISEVIETIKENDLQGLCIEELHQRAFNQDYFIIGYYEAEKWLVANYGIFAAIEKIQEYEQSIFGEVNTNLGNSESVCNMLTYILKHKNTTVFISSKQYAPEIKSYMIATKATNFNKHASIEDKETFETQRNNFLNN